MLAPECGSPQVPSLVVCTLVIGMTVTTARSSLTVQPDPLLLGTNTISISTSRLQGLIVMEIIQITPGSQITTPRKKEKNLIQGRERFPAWFSRQCVGSLALRLAISVSLWEEQCRLKMVSGTDVVL